MKNSKKEIRKLKNLKLQAEQLLTSEIDVYRGGKGKVSISSDENCSIGCSFGCIASCMATCTVCTTSVGEVIVSIP